MCWGYNAKFKSCFQSFVLAMCHWEITPRQGRAADFDQDGLREAVESNLHESSRQLAFDLDTSKSTIGRLLKKIGKGSKPGVWILHNVSEKNKDCISIATSLLSSQKNGPFLKKNEFFTTIFNAILFFLTF